MKGPTQWGFLSPSSTLQRLLQNVPGLSQSQVLDLGCGFGRNAILMAAHGCEVVCVDRDLDRLRTLEASKISLLDLAPVRSPPGIIYTLCADVNSTLWPFKPESFDVLLNVHFVNMDSIQKQIPTLRPEGYFYLETFGGQGKNFLDLPRSGDVRKALGGKFRFIYFEEHSASKACPSAVAVRALAQRTAV